MIGYRCNVCGEKISEREYNNLKEKNDLRCKACGKGYYESCFTDEDNNEGFTEKFKDIIKKTDKLPGATKSNRLIGTVLGGILGGIIISGWLSFIGLIAGGFLGYVLSPYFMPHVRKFIKWLKKEIALDDDEKNE